MRPLTPAFASAITEAASTTGALIIADEVQSGLGRTGYPFYSPVLGLHPASDLDRQGARRRRAGRGGAGQPGGRGHNRVRGSREHVRRQPARVPCGALLPRRAGRRRADRTQSRGSAAISSGASARWPPGIRSIKEVRGAGLIWGLELTRDAAPVVQEGLARGVIVNRTAETVVRLLPPLVITETEIDEALGRLDAAFGAVGAASMKPRGRVTLRSANDSEARSLHALISANLAEGHLLPRTLGELARARHAIRRRDARASNRRLRRARRTQPAGRRSALARGRRSASAGKGVGTMIVDELRRRARREGFEKLCAFTHAPAYFIQMGFSIVPHTWLLEKVTTDCVKCPLFRSVRAVRDGRADRRDVRAGRRIGLRRRPRAGQSQPAAVARYA